MNKIRKKKRIFIGLLLLIATGFLIWQNKTIGVTHFTFRSEDLPAELDGLRILHISDLHNWDTKGQLIALAQEECPDVIFITGDLMDGRNTRIDIALELSSGLMGMAPVYYVQGNHEGRSSTYPILRRGLLDLGVVVLEDQVAEFSWKGKTVGIGGLRDPSGKLGALYDGTDELEEGTKKRLEQMMSLEEQPILFLLSHRPELMEVYVQMEIPLVFAGHSHGGQIRLPFLGGLIAPNQGLFPKYDGGFYVEGDTSMVVSRGLGNSIFPLRVFNPPELVVVECEAER